MLKLGCSILDQDATRGTLPNEPPAGRRGRPANPAAPWELAAPQTPSQGGPGDRRAVAGRAGRPPVYTVCNLYKKKKPVELPTARSAIAHVVGKIENLANDYSRCLTRKCSQCVIPATKRSTPTSKRPKDGRSWLPADRFRSPRIAVLSDVSCKSVLMFGDPHAPRNARKLAQSTINLVSHAAHCVGPVFRIRSCPPNN